MSWLRRAGGKARRLQEISQEGGLGAAVAEARKNVWSTTVAYGLCRDMTVPFEAPVAKVPIRIRPLEPRDLDYILDPDLGDSPVQLMRQRRLVDAEVGTCWVAVTEDDEPRYMQWMIGPEDNARMSASFGSEFPPMQPGEALLEGAFVPRRHRGGGVAAHGMSLIAETGPPGTRRVWTFVTTDNIPTLKMVAKAGFHPTSLRRSRWRLLTQHTSFEPLEDSEQHLSPA